MIRHDLNVGRNSRLSRNTHDDIVVWKFDLFRIGRFNAGHNVALESVSQPPCRVETKRILSLLTNSYLSSPSSSQSESLMSTRIPGRLFVFTILVPPRTYRDLKDIHGIVENEKLLSRIFHKVFTDISDQVADSGRVAVVRIAR